MPVINGIPCAELIDPLSQGSTLREITLQYEPAYTKNGLDDQQALDQTLSVNTPHGADDPVEQDQKVYLTPSVYDEPSNAGA